MRGVGVLQRSASALPTAGPCSWTGDRNDAAHHRIAQPGEGVVKPAGQRAIDGAPRSAERPHPRPAPFAFR